LPASSALSDEVHSTAKNFATVMGLTEISKMSPQELLPVTDKKVQFHPVSTVTLGDEQQTAVNKATPAPAVVLTSGNALDTAKNNTFTATLEALSKDNLKAQQIDPVKATLPNQTVVANAMAGLVQNGITPLAANQNGVTPVVQAMINTPVSRDTWGNEFTQKVTWMVTQHDQTAQLHLNPPNLGPLDVVLNVSGDQATALFTSPHAAVRDAVEQALPQLRNMLADNGITLGNAMVSDQSPKDQQAWQTSQQQKGNAGASRTLEVNRVTAEIPAAANVSLGRIHQGMVDTFV
jgi:flagellar hook-length control protein FliK